MIVSAPGLSPQRAADPHPVRLAAVRSFPFFVRRIVAGPSGGDGNECIDSRYGFHRDLANFISRPRHQRKEASLVICPRGFLKSTICTILHPIWCLLVDAEESTMIMHGIEKKAQSYFAEIERTICKSPLLSWIAPDVFGKDPAKDLDWKEHTLRVLTKRTDKVPSIACFGMNSSTAGHHYTLYKLDDLVNDANYQTPAGIEQPITKFQDVMMTQRDMRARVDVMDTVYANDDLTQWLQDPENGWRDGLDIFHRRWWVQNGQPWQGAPVFGPDGEPFKEREESWWPEVKPVEFIRRHERNKIKFAQQFECEPAVDGARLFRKEWIREYAPSYEGDEVVLPGGPLDESGAEKRNWRIDMTLDAIAAESGDSKDKACILVGARNDLGELWLLDLFYDRPDNADWYDTVHAFWCKWRPKSMPMEQTGVSSALYRALAEDGKRRNARYPLTKARRAAGGRGSSAKMTRAESLQSFVSAGMVYMPEGEKWKGPRREITAYQYGIKEQQDDFLDCLFDLWDLSKPPPLSKIAQAERAWGVAPGIPLPGHVVRNGNGIRELARVVRRRA